MRARRMIATLPTVTRFHIERRDAHGNGIAGLIVFGGEPCLWSFDPLYHHAQGELKLVLHTQSAVGALVYEKHVDKIADAIAALSCESKS